MNKGLTNKDAGFRLPDNSGDSLGRVDVSSASYYSPTTCGVAAARAGSRKYNAAKGLRNSRPHGLVTAQRAYGWSPAELVVQYPHLSGEQVQAALAYYRTHQQELDADIEPRWQFAEAARRKVGPSPLAAKLRAQGRLP